MTTRRIKTHRARIDELTKVRARYLRLGEAAKKKGDFKLAERLTRKAMQITEEIRQLS